MLGISAQQGRRRGEGTAGAGRSLTSGVRRRSSAVCAAGCRSAISPSSTAAYPATSLSKPRGD